MPVSRTRKRHVTVNITEKEPTFRPDNDVINKWEWASRLTQPFVLVILLIRVVAYIPDPAWWEMIFFWSGTALGMGSQLYLFTRTRLTNKRLLLTSGVFKYTRHPMYTGAALADMSMWYSGIDQPGFLSTAITLYASMMFVGWLHEQEILAKFGPAAERYYARTPRLFFLYPFTKKG